MGRFCAATARLVLADRLSAHHRVRLMGGKRKLRGSRLPDVGLGSRGRCSAGLALFYLGCEVRMEDVGGSTSADRSCGSIDCVDGMECLQNLSEPHCEVMPAIQRLRCAHEVHKNMPIRIATMQTHCSRLIRSCNTSAANASVTSG